MLSDNKKQAVERLINVHPNHKSEVLQAIDEVIKENIKVSSEQIFLGWSISELQSARDMVKGIMEPTPASEPIPEPIPEPVTTPVTEPASEPIPTPVVKKGKDPFYSKKNKKSADLLA